MAAVNTLDFPPTLGSEVAQGRHYMLIDSYESTSAIATGNKLSSIGLYIPSGSLKTSYTGNYEGKEGASLKAGAVGAGGDFMSKLMKFDFTQKAAADVLSAITGISDVGSAFASRMLASSLDKGGFVSASGNTPNNYMALVYGGPNEFRQHTFDFKFFPRNVAESDTVRGIINEFKKGTLPRMSNPTGTGGVSGKTLVDPFFKSPRQHKIKFVMGGTGAENNGSSNQYLFNIGTSVIRSMGVNYDPQSTVGFHSNGAPVQIDLSLTFQEIAFEISQDNVDGINASIGTQVQQNQSSLDSIRDSSGAVNPFEARNRGLQ
jgi:hypothetical protein